MDLRCDNETRTGFRKEDSQASAFSRRPPEGSRILDSGFRDLSRASSTCFVILDSGFSGRKSPLSSFELKSQLFSLQLERMDSGYWILDLAWHLADLMPRVLVSKVTPPPPSGIPDLGSSLISTGTTTKFLPYLGRNPES